MAICVTKLLAEDMSTLERVTERGGRGQDACSQPRGGRQFQVVPGKQHAVEYFKSAALRWLTLYHTF
jgi:hypothetical protein